MYVDDYFERFGENFATKESGTEIMYAKSDPKYGNLPGSLIWL